MSVSIMRMFFSGASALSNSVLSLTGDDGVEEADDVEEASELLCDSAFEAAAI